MQVFTVSHCFELADIIHRSVAALIGAWSALFIVEVTQRPTWRRGPGLAAPSSVLFFLGAAQLLVILIGTLKGSASSASPARIYWIPFEALWRQHSGVATHSIIATMFAYGAIAATLVMLFVRVGIARPARIACVGVAALAVMAEGLRALMNTGQVDVTTPILATIGAAVTVRLYVTLRRVFRAAHGTDYVRSVSIRK